MAEKTSEWHLAHNFWVLEFGFLRFFLNQRKIPQTPKQTEGFIVTKKTSKEKLKQKTKMTPDKNPAITPQFPQDMGATRKHTIFSSLKAVIFSCTFSLTNTKQSLPSHP